MERFVLQRMLGWKIINNFPDIKKSITVFAPHTSYWDAVIGKLVLRSYDVPHTLLSKKELFRFPMVIVMRLLGAIPIGGVKGHNAIHDAVTILESSEQMHLVICPEGQLAPTDRWNPGFYYMAVKAHVPIVVVYLDYAKKEAGVKGVINELDNQNEVYRQLAEMYSGVTARHPEYFLLPKYKESV
ncbi:MAG: 1-acyl-sn-glycerol-3-phosphate acyltransferase [Bacteroidaceae bacterium]|nr:1-acyl-sn-glycerol-3-phosphate acyltransferase [Bacteroidaceae bacterium]